MKFLVDNQLPAAVARWIAAKGHDAVHVLDLGMGREDDRRLWDLAWEQDRIMVSKDEDFFFLANRSGEQGRLLWLRFGNTRKLPTLERLEQSWEDIVTAFDNGQRVVELR